VDNADPQRHVALPVISVTIHTLYVTDWGGGSCNFVIYKYFKISITMKKVYLLLIAFTGFAVNAFACRNCDPDSLVDTTITGVVILSGNGANARYYLDTDGNAVADFHLNFGPHWYTPEGSTAMRPANGDTVDIHGGFNPTSTGTYPVVVVYEIDGLFWRNPYEPFWNNFSNNYDGSGQSYGYSPGWLQDSLTWITLTGTALVDTTMRNEKFFLDINSDDLADYHLNFGPSWYTSNSGVPLPAYGDQIVVKGFVIDLNNLPCLIVFTLDGSEWRDSTGYGSHRFGGWITQNMGQSHQIGTPFDTVPNMVVSPGWHQVGQPDSLYCQMLEYQHQNMPVYMNQNGFMGFGFSFFGTNGNNLMSQNQWHLTFANNLQFQFHYQEQQLNNYNGNEATVGLKRWNHQSGVWETVAGTTVDDVDNTVSFSTSDVAGFYMLSADRLTAMEDQLPSQSGIVTVAAYPNPFSSVTDVAFELENPTRARIAVYNIAGQEIAELANRSFSSGKHSVRWNAGDQPAGLYFLRMETGLGHRTEKLVLNR
jgi:hypothetical protein